MDAFLQFIFDCCVAYALWNYELSPIAIILFWPTWMSVYYVLYKVFYDWPWDYRVWRSGGIGKASFSTEDFTRR